MEQHITSEATHQMWSDPETISGKLIRHWLEWLGHLVRMGDSRTEHYIYLGGYPRNDHLVDQERDGETDLQTVGLLDTWYTSALHRDQWDNLYKGRVS